LPDMIAAASRHIPRAPAAGARQDADNAAICNTRALWS
jgi:hypothetical protein